MIESDSILNSWRATVMHEIGHTVTALALGISVRSIVVEKTGRDSVSGECSLIHPERHGITRGVAVLLAGWEAVYQFAHIIHNLPLPPVAVEALSPAIPVRPRRQRLPNYHLAMSRAQLKQYDKKTSDRAQIQRLLKGHHSGDIVLQNADVLMRQALSLNTRLLAVMAGRLSVAGQIAGDELAGFAAQIVKLEI